MKNTSSISERGMNISSSAIRPSAPFFYHGTAESNLARKFLIHKVGALAFQETLNINEAIHQSGYCSFEADNGTNSLIASEFVDWNSGQSCIEMLNARQDLPLVQQSRIKVLIAKNGVAVGRYRYTRVCYADDCFAFSFPGDFVRLSDRLQSYSRLLIAYDKSGDYRSHRSYRLSPSRIKRSPRGKINRPSDDDKGGHKQYKSHCPKTEQFPNLPPHDVPLHFLGIVA